MSESNGKARYIMIGGFLGAGKSTSILKLATYLMTKGKSVGLITNDQSVGLVDTEMLRSHDLEVEEIAGGCFCCRFDSLVEAATKLSESSRPDIFLAEPVGSCTDLVASVSYPLRRIYGNDYSIAPLSVLVDPNRALNIMGVEDGKSFSDKVKYIYKKQLEEAHIIVINKRELLDDERLQKLTDALRAAFPDKEVVAVSARHGTGMDDWFDSIADAEMEVGETMELDYEVYAEGEALLGWLNSTLTFNSTQPIDGEVVMMDLAADVQKTLKAGEHEVAHFKMTLAREGGAGDVAVLNLVNNTYVPELSQSLFDKIEKGQLIVNIRAEGPPEVLKEALVAAIARRIEAHEGLSLDVDHLEHLRPGKPEPTYRMAITDMTEA